MAFRVASAAVPSYLPSAMQKSLIPPRADRRPAKAVHHGHTRSDDYSWLRADNWQEVMRNPAALAEDIRAYLDAENAYFAAAMADTGPLQETLFKEMRGRIKEDDSSVPSPDGPWAYAVRFVEGGQHPLYVREKRDGGGEEVMLDGNALAVGRAYFRIGGVAHSPDHRLLAWSHDDAGSEFFLLSVRDLENGGDLADVIPDTSGGAVWSANGHHLFYVRLDANHRPSRVFRHRLGTSPETDVLVYEESDPGFFVGLDQTKSRRFVLIQSHDHQTSEVRTIPADAPEDAPRLIAPREVAVEYSVDEANGTFFILTNAGSGSKAAKDFRIVTAPVEAPGRENWTDLVPHEAGRLVTTHDVTARHLVRLERFEGLPRIVVRRLADGAEHTIAFEEEAYSLGLMGGYEFDTDALRFAYSSMATPSRIYDYDMESRQRVLRKEQEVPSGHDPSLYVTRRVMAPTPDGEMVPISLLYRKETPLDGSAPALLYGYGAYGIAMPAGFSITRLSLVDRGFVYAIAHIRGGKDKGYAWYKSGRRASKANTFTDFIAAGEFLAAERFTSRGRIVAQGGSAGGMLIGAVANMSTDLFGGIRRQRALRRRVEHDARRHAAAHASRMAGVGQPDRRGGGLSDDACLFALRKRQREALSADAGSRRPDRSARHLLGAGEMGGAAARTQDRRQSSFVAHQHGGRTRWRRGPLRRAEGDGDRDRLRVEGHGQGWITAHP